MPYQSLANEKNMNLEMPDASFQCPSISQMIKVNHTRRVLLLLTGIQFVVYLCIIFAEICAYLFGYVLKGPWNHPIVQLIPVLSCMCFLVGSLAAERRHVKGLYIFVKLALLNLIVTYVIVTIYIAIPIGLKICAKTILAKIISGVIYQILFCIVSFLPAYTINTANRLSEFLNENKYSPIK